MVSFTHGSHAGRVSIGYFIFNIRAEPMILMGTATASFIAIAHGYTWDDILQSICNKISEALPVILIVASIGFLIGCMDGVRHYSNDDLLWFEVD